MWSQAIVVASALHSFWFSRFHRSRAVLHADTFIRILGASSIMLTFVFYFNLVKSQDDARSRSTPTRT